MKTFAILTVFLCFCSTLLALTPVQEARNHLERAIGLLNKKEQGAGKKRLISLPNIISILSNTESSLNEVKKNKGTNIHVALKFVATAKAELEAAKSGAESEHLEQAEAALQEALKRVLKMIQLNHM